MEAKMLNDLRADLNLSKHRLVAWINHISREIEHIDDMMVKIDLIVLNEGDKNGTN